MDWIIFASILAGFAVGFSTGASPTPTGGASKTTDLKQRVKSAVDC